MKFKKIEDCAKFQCEVIGCTEKARRATTVEGETRFTCLQHEEKVNPQEYNGWTNYATWRVNLEIIDGFEWNPKETTFKDLYELENYVKNTIEMAIENSVTEENSLASQYAHAFISDVNYNEIAKNVAENYPDLITGTNTQNGEKI